MTCIQLNPWVPVLLGLAAVGGALIGFGLRSLVDYAELETYRWLARKEP